ncbi:hypothetical protein [Roseibium algae]|uniref:Uncharacterized protein n=1 Tax=Roseibium algae TaxID=3123038 RepID=A0ABU8THA0_9HYPH
MTNTKDTSDEPLADRLRSLNPLNAYMAACGDGPDPRLAKALAQTGSVSGEPVSTTQGAGNVITVDFASTKDRSRARRDAAASADKVT